MEVEVLNMEGKKVRTVELPPEIFEAPINIDLMHQAMVMQMANARLGTHETKVKSDVSGGGRKPWRQKGTGRARQGSIRSPQWRGGGIVFGPTPRSYSFKLPKKVRRLALKSALSTKVGEQNFLVLDALTFAAPKTKEFTQVLKALSIEKKALFVTADLDENVALSARNIPGVTVVTASGISVLDLLGHDKVVFTKAAVEKVEEVLG